MSISRALFHGIVALLLTVLTQIGGLAWLIALAFRRRWIAFPIAYAALWLAAFLAAPFLGRVALPCTGEPLRSASPLYCVMARHYVAPDLRDAAVDLAQHLDRTHPGTVTETLDAGFPFPMPMLPHLSHDDGGQLDLALWWTDDGAYRAGASPSPIGYFGFADGPTNCPDRRLSLRWDLDWLQPLLPEREPDLDRLATALSFVKDDARIGRILVEPHLAETAGVTGGTIRFQGCRAARHDDHIHIQR